MNVDDAGGAITGGLIAGAIEKPTGKAGERRTTCSDCGAPVSANFCAECGQPTHVHRKLTHLGEELLHGVMHFDGRLWKTLPLLFFRPGKLTRDWVMGMRTRYVSPLAAFLFAVFLTFFLTHTFPPKEDAIKINDTSSPASAADAAEVKAEIERARAELAVAGENTPAARAALDFAQGAADAQANAPAGKAASGSSGFEAMKEKARSGAYDADIDTGNKKLDEKLRKIVRNPDLAIYKVEQAIYKLAVLLVPLSIPAVALLFLWRKGTTLYDHGVFVLYSLTFMTALLLFVSYAGGTWLQGPAGLAFTLAPPVHIFFQLKDAYALSVFSALWRTAALLVLSWIVLGVWFLIILAMGLLG